MEKIVLASSSPRRRELMAQAGFRFEVIVSEADENIEVEAPDRMVEELSKRKAGAVAELVKTQGFAEDSVLIVGADTMVSIDGKKLGKPAGEAGTEAMLKELSGRTHQVYTGVALDAVRQGVYTVHSFVQRTDVFVYPMTDAEIEAYMDTGEPFDKAGAYGIQGRFGKYIEKINGDYLNVVGLPLGRLYQEMKRLGLTEDAR